MSAKIVSASRCRRDKNRVHLDVHATDREAEITRLVSLGATRHDTRHEFGVEWTVLTDPEGNEFCVAQQ